MGIELLMKSLITEQRVIILFAVENNNDDFHALPGYEPQPLGLLAWTSVPDSTYWKCTMIVSSDLSFCSALIVLELVGHPILFSTGP